MRHIVFIKYIYFSVNYPYHPCIVNDTKEIKMAASVAKSMMLNSESKLGTNRIDTNTNIPAQQIVNSIPTLNGIGTSTIINNTVVSPVVDSGHKLPIPIPGVQTGERAVPNLQSMASFDSREIPTLNSQPNHVSQNLVIPSNQHMTNQTSNLTNAPVQRMNEMQTISEHGTIPYDHQPQVSVPQTNLPTEISPNSTMPSTANIQSMPNSRPPCDHELMNGAAPSTQVSTTPVQGIHPVSTSGDINDEIDSQVDTTGQSGNEQNGNGVKEKKKKKKSKSTRTPSEEEKKRRKKEEKKERKNREKDNKLEG